jgi:serine/threonine-protein kinase
MRDMLGTRIGPYRILAELGTGGFGAVYEVEDVDSDEHHALKLLRPELADSPQAVARFEREISAARKLSHESCCNIVASGRAPEPYFVMELLEGEELTARLEQQGRLSIDETLEVLRPVVSVLAEAHACGIVHRDIKASNVFLCDSGRVVLLDFGIAKVLDGPERSLTLSRQIIGTPVAMAPEQILGDPVDRRTDVYALGALVYQMLTGEPVFDAPTATMMRMMHLHAARRTASERAPLPAAVDTVLAVAMAIEPEARYPSVQAFWRALQAALLRFQPGEERTESAVTAFVSQAPCDAENFAACLQEASTRLEQAGFEIVVESSHGFVACLRLNGEKEAPDAMRALDRVTRRLSSDFPDALKIQVQQGEVRVAGDRIIGGCALEPPPVAQLD